MPILSEEKRSIAPEFMVTIVGIFDNSRDLDQAVQRLADAGFDDTVYDEALVADKRFNLGKIFAPGSAPVAVLANVEPNVPHKPDLPTIARSFKNHLAEYHLPQDVIEAYATTFYHDGKFVLVKIDAEHANQVIQILRECGASRANRHD